MESSSYEKIVRVVTLWNAALSIPDDGQGTCNISADVEVRPVGCLRSQSRTIQILGDLFMFSSRSRKSLLGALFLGALLSWATTCLAQDSGRKIVKKIPVT